MLISYQFIKRTITATILGLGFWILYIFLPPQVFSFVLCVILAQIIFFEWKNLFAITSPIFWILLPLYPILPFYLLIKMNNSPVYHDLLLFIFVIVSSHDTGSYIVGSLCGKRAILPAISPKKTWEGFFGGFLFACAGLMFLFWERGTIKSYWFVLGFAASICSLSFLGDLFESWLKRRANIKDSGSVLPGHGGFLDRFDGILFAVIFFYLFRDYLLVLLK